MVTLRESGAEANPFIANDVNRHIFAMSPTGTKPRMRWFLTTTANIRPGMIVKRVANATGGYSIVELAGSDRDAYGFVEWDEKQLGQCYDAGEATYVYASGDLVPVIPLSGNSGVILRNIILLNPAAAANPSTQVQADAVGCSVADGTGLIVGSLEYYLTNPAANTRVVISMMHTLDVAI